MQIQWFDMVQALIGLVAGGVIGLGFGTIQNLALHRHQRMEKNGNLKSGWTVMPGSMRRVAYLLIALVIVQVFCPLLFVGGTQWWVSGGVVAGYGTILLRELRHRVEGRSTPN